MSQKKVCSGHRNICLFITVDKYQYLFTEPQALHVVSSLTEMPEGASISDTDDNQNEADDPHRALDIDLDV